MKHEPIILSAGLSSAEILSLLHAHSMGHIGADILEIRAKHPDKEIMLEMLKCEPEPPQIDPTIFRKEGFHERANSNEPFYRRLQKRKKGR